MTTNTDPAVARLTGPDGPFEIVVEDVLGRPTQVYKTRLQSLRDLMAQNVARADLEWLVQGDERYTFGEHDRRARVLAARLHELGVERGDRVALVSANVPEWVITWWACAVLGAVVVPLNAWWKTEELEFSIIDSASKVLVADARRVEMVRERLPEMRELQHVFAIGKHGDHPVRPFADLIADPGDPGLPPGTVSEDLYLVDRAKDMIIRAGENVYCVEVEHVLFDHPDVIDAAVVGVPHKTLGEEVKAVVQLKPGAIATVDEIREFCRKHLGDFKVPAYVELRDEPLPRNPAGKVLKNLLRGDETAIAAADDQTL
ncbi:MAG: class I adenylate-forming enzyme family protein [Actinomycetota bacterium]